MVVNRRKKNVRMRGSQTHGWGAKKKHRGAGNRGGRGMAGTGKRADSKKPSIWKLPYFGQHGFFNHNPKKYKDVNAVTTKDVEEKIRVWQKLGLVSEDKGFIVIDLPKIGFKKLVANGKITKKMRIIVPYASKSVIERVKKAGGEVITSKQNQKED